MSALPFLVGKIHPNVPCGSRLECLIRFLDWARSHRQVPTAQEIAEFLGCSRATGWRYRNALLAAQGSGHDRDHQIISRSCTAAGPRHRGHLA